MKKLIMVICFLVLPSTVYAHKLTVVYTGNSYASLYPCGHCPASVGGGVARRATVITDIKAKNPNILILDAGNFTAGGQLDESSINPSMDEKRSVYYYSAMQDMGYDAVNLGEAEFNFGIDFAKNNLTKFKTVSANVDIGGALPYYMKQFKNFKVGVIGLAPQSIHKSTGLKVKNYEKALNSVLAELKGKVDFIILLSSLGEQENYDIAKKFIDIKLILSSGNILNYSSVEEKIGDTIIVKPSYLAKDVRVIDLDVKLNKILSYSIKRVPLPLTVNENQKVMKAIPACFTDGDCGKKKGLVLACQNPGASSAVCAYFEPQKFEAVVITDINCKFCSTQFSEDMLKDLFMGINFKAVDYRTSEAVELIKKYSIASLPAFLLPEEVKKNSSFANVTDLFEEKNGKIIPKKELSGVFLFLDRKEIPGRIDFFLNPYKPEALGVLKDLVQFSLKNKVSLNVQFIFEEASDSVGYPQEEVKIAYAVKKVFPDKFNNYLLVRLGDIKTKSWVESLEAAGLDYKKVKVASNSKEVVNLITENEKMLKSVNVTSGNVILVNNNRIFKVFQVNPADLQEFFRKK
ncbi:MAG: hypothetical protein WCY05_02720 [Candidatus Omnitrophota bacterium]